MQTSILSVAEVNDTVRDWIAHALQKCHNLRLVLEIFDTCDQVTISEKSEAVDYALLHSSSTVSDAMTMIVTGAVLN